jgi:hypothetical protein
MYKACGLSFGGVSRQMKGRRLSYKLSAAEGGGVLSIQPHDIFWRLLLPKNL